MPELTVGQYQKNHDTLNRFLSRWSLQEVKQMTLQQYNSLDNKDSFCYWLEHISDNLGRIRGNYSSMFGIWQMRGIKESSSKVYKNNDTYKWFSKYGDLEEEVFKKVKNKIIEIIESAQSEEFHRIDEIDYNSLPKWKIAFIYSDYKLLPVYKKGLVQQIAENFEHTNVYKIKISELHRYILEQKEESQDYFDFAWEQFHIADQQQNHNYYIIGSKYGDGNGNNTVDVSQNFYKHNVIATGFFWEDDLSHLYGRGREYIDNWIDKNLKEKYPDNYGSSKRTLSYFLGIKVGDIIAIKSHGQYGDLTIIAYAEVVEVHGKVYFHSMESDLRHCINVNFLETNLYKNVGLSYGQTIHKIIPNQRKGHFQKIYGSYSLLNESEKETEDFELSESRINEKQTQSQQREVSYTATVHKTHNKIQSAFAKHLEAKYPNDIIQTEYKFIDIVRQNNKELFYYEVKPYSTAYNCIRSAIGQLLDYYHSNPHSQKKIHLYVVGFANITDSDSMFINFLKNSLNLSFNYIPFKL